MGIQISVRNSAGALSICLYPLKNERIGTVRWRSAAFNTNWASRASNRTVASAIGEAPTTFPPTVARLRICSEAIHCMNTAISGTSCRMAGWAANSAKVVSAPPEPGHLSGKSPASLDGERGNALGRWGAHPQAARRDRCPRRSPMLDRARCRTGVAGQF